MIVFNDWRQRYDQVRRDKRAAVIISTVLYGFIAFAIFDSALHAFVVTGFVVAAAATTAMFIESY